MSGHCLVVRVNSESRVLTFYPARKIETEGVPVSEAIRHEGFWWRYDSSTDTLHVTIDPSLPACGEALKNFEGLVIIMHGMDDDRVVGLRLLEAKRNGLHQILVLIDQERRAIQSFRFSGKVPEWTPDETTKHYARDLEEAWRILTRSPEKVRKDLQPA